MEIIRRDELQELLDVVRMKRWIFHGWEIKNGNIHLILQMLFV